MTRSAREERKSRVIEVLNKARAMELHAIGQYMNQHYSLDDMDFGELAAQMKLIAIDEMRHAEMFAERIKELGGDPTTLAANSVESGQDMDVIFAFDTELEDEGIASYNEFLTECHDCGDSISAKLFDDIIDDEQAHFNYFDNVNGHIKKLGAAYLAQKAGTPSATGLNTQGFVARKSGGAPA
ncbi:bacterioferritin [Desulfoluna limicola]|uniref:Bacterioferritin n=1 Tax=Desulfoluna limicola TaxID=2810562 RepID=A0ABM7PFF9_9BACT|nr:bacterioferritin [Desulfoluna limicola]BCS96319.1 bacterioferritin [Desulfoluna limicola]